MGIVYKGHHAILRRPTAIKLLNLEKVNESSIERFEREVQITSQLNHPNTVAIYDYGRTDEGVFYYAMEFLDGIDLQALVEKYGPQSEARVIHILQQVCGSLYEAHSLGLVHRDIKPANLMLNRRGGEPDVVKVLDFGLVKALDEAKQASQSASGGLTGTPLYMSPEAIQTPNAVDSRSDLYAVGAVGYFLLTGQPVFSAADIVELCRQHITKVPDPPSQRLGKAISPELESALLACLEKTRAKPPADGRATCRCFCAAAPPRAPGRSKKPTLGGAATSESTNGCRPAPHCPISPRIRRCGTLRMKRRTWGMAIRRRTGVRGPVWQGTPMLAASPASPMLPASTHRTSSPPPTLEPRQRRKRSIRRHSALRLRRPPGAARRVPFVIVSQFGRSIAAQPRNACLSPACAYDFVDCRNPPKESNVSWLL